VNANTSTANIRVRCVPDSSAGSAGKYPAYYISRES